VKSLLLKSAEFDSTINKFAKENLLKEVIKAQEDAKIATDKARELYIEYLKNEERKR
jgi:hypothetical protein